jgi:hypothetical protein
MVDNYVSRACVVRDKACSLIAKCRICKKEIADTNEIERMNKVFGTFDKLSKTEGGLRQTEGGLRQTEGGIRHN